MAITDMKKHNIAEALKKYPELVPVDYDLVETCLKYGIHRDSFLTPRLDPSGNIEKSDDNTKYIMNLVDLSTVGVLHAGGKFITRESLLYRST